MAAGVHIPMCLQQAVYHSTAGTVALETVQLAVVQATGNGPEVAAAHHLRMVEAETARTV